jgi:nicotinate-nucleotide pyrophosphorylase (carboxylating)
VLENIGLVKALIDLALQEDIGAGDVTTNSIVTAGQKATGFIVAKKEGIIAGLPVAKAVFDRVGPGVSYYPEISDGTLVKAGQTLVKIEGDARTILTGERLALNFLQRLSGIATYTNRLANLIKGYKTKIVDTRKTSPGARILEKYAVRMGGGGNHRLGLYDAVLIKDNHIQVAGSITRAIQLARAAIPFTMKVEVEVENLAGVLEALEAGADIIMLDNMEPPAMAEAVKIIAGRALVEASGGINEKNLLAVAQAGVDFVSIGALTHSAQALDISLDIT